MYYLLSIFIHLYIYCIESTLPPSPPLCIGSTLCYLDVGGGCAPIWTKNQRTNRNLISVIALMPNGTTRHHHTLTHASVHNIRYSSSRVLMSIAKCIVSDLLLGRMTEHSRHAGYYYSYSLHTSLSFGPFSFVCQSCSRDGLVSSTSRTCHRPWHDRIDWETNKFLSHFTTIFVYRAICKMAISVRTIGPVDHSEHGSWQVCNGVLRFVCPSTYSHGSWFEYEIRS